MKETRKGRAYETFELLAQILSFPSKIDEVIQYLDQLITTDSLINIGKVENVLKRISSGT